MKIAYVLYSQRERERVRERGGNLVFYAQSTIAVISGRQADRARERDAHLYEYYV